MWVVKQRLHIGEDWSRERGSIGKLPGGKQERSLAEKGNLPRNTVMKRDREATMNAGGQH